MNRIMMIFLFPLLLGFTTTNTEIIIAWTTSNITLPTAKCGQMGLYDESKDSIWLIGGWEYSYYSPDIYTLDIASGLWTTHNPLPIAPGLDPPLWTSIQNTLYWMDMYSSFLYSFNIDREEYKQEDIAVPAPGCLTSYTSRYLIVVASDGQNNLKIYDFETNQWTTNSPSMSTMRHLCACVVHNDYLYAIGGRNANSIYLNTVEKIELTGLLEWTQLTDTLSQSLSLMRAISVGDNIYVIGGYTGYGNSNRVEIISTLNDSIIRTTNINHWISRATATHGPGNSIMIFGGRDDLGGDYVIDAIQISIANVLTPTSNPTTRPTTGIPTVISTVIPTVEPTLSPTIEPTLSPIVESTLDPTYKPTVNPTNGPTESPTKELDAEWIVKDVGGNCDDGYTDLDNNDPYYDQYCKRCEEGTAGTSGNCIICGTLEESNHTRTECGFFHPAWLYVAEILAGLTCIVAIIMYLYKAMVHKESWKEKKSAQAEAIFDDSTHQWLFSMDVTCTEKLLGYFAVIIQIISYAMLVNMATETADNHDSEMCFSYAGSTFVALFVFGYLLRDMIGLFSVGCLNICATLMVIFEVMCAIATVVIADIYAEDEFAAVSAGIGVLFVHDLDEQIYGALSKIKKNSRKFMAFALWIIIAVAVAVLAHKGGCENDTV